MLGQQQFNHYQPIQVERRGACGAKRLTASPGLCALHPQNPTHHDIRQPVVNGIEMLSGNDTNSDELDLEPSFQLPHKYQQAIRRALKALTLFEEEKSHVTPSDLEDVDKPNHYHDLRNALRALTSKSLTKSPSTEFLRIRGDIGEAMSQFRIQHIPQVQTRFQHKVRHLVSGSPYTPVREYWRTQRTKPTMVRLLDKFAFLWGVLSLMTSEYILLVFPDSFWIWYVVFMGSMLLARFPAYYEKKWHYFLLDFCYFAQFSNFLQIWLFPSNCTFFKVNFAFGVGPLCAAVILWRNSLVFHDNERVTTVWIHILPSWLVYASRWSSSSSGRLVALSSCSGFDVSDFCMSLLIYGCWQFSYFLKTEVLDVSLLDRDPSIQTSLRWLALDTQRPIHKLVLTCLRRCGVMHSEEVFHPAQLKTKVVFMASQFVYTALAMLPVPIIYTYHTVSGIFVFGIFCVSVYNGGEYYIEVFSRRYYQQFQKEATFEQQVVDDHTDIPMNHTTGEKTGDTPIRQSGSDTQQSSRDPKKGKTH